MANFVFVSSIEDDSYDQTLAFNADHILSVFQTEPDSSVTTIVLTNGESYDIKGNIREVVRKLNVG